MQHVPLADRRKDAGRILAEAFQAEPGYAHVIPEPEARRRGLRFLMPALAGIHRETSFVTLDGDEVVCASLWVRWNAGPSLASYVRHGLLVMPLYFAPATLLRMVRVTRRLQAIKERHAPFPHHHLDTFGVAPALQGRGVGSRALRAELAEWVDPSGLHATLFTSTPANVTFYERQGFEVRHTERFDQRFTSWFMVRSPRAAG